MPEWIGETLGYYGATRQGRGAKPALPHLKDIAAQAEEVRAALVKGGDATGAAKFAMLRDQARKAVANVGR